MKIFHSKAIQLLRANQYNVLSIAESFPGISDEQIIQLANDQGRLILTFDRDFGFLIFSKGIIPKNGICYFRLSSFRPLDPGELSIKVLSEPGLQFENVMTVVEDNFIRQKKF